MKNDKTEISSLILLLKDESPAQRLLGAKKLANLAKEGKLTFKVLDPVLESLNDSERKFRHIISTTLGWLAYKCEIRKKSMLIPAIILLEDEVAMIRHDAAWILESLAKSDIIDLKSIDPLLSNLSHKNNHVKAASVYALGTLVKHGVKDNRILKSIQLLENDSDEGVKDAINTVLKSL